MNKQPERSKIVLRVDKVTGDMISFIVNHYKGASFGAGEIHFIDQTDKEHFEENYGYK